MIGKRLSHFVIEEKLGEGGMGVVYKARDEKLGRHVALKVLQENAVGSEERRLRFLREARAAAAVTHPHIAAIYEIDEVDGVVFIAMELVEGQTLGPLIENRALPRRNVLRHSLEIAEALTRAHQANVVHRDLKPDNIIVGSDGHVKILDFGLAKLLEDAQETSEQEAESMKTISAEMTKAGRVLGTAAYMSPEQARGLPVDSRSDLFSLGIVIYEMATGRRPFEGRTATDTLSAILRDQPTSPEQQNPDVPPDLVRVIDKCLQKEAADRYQHAEDIVVDLRRLRRETDSQPLQRASITQPQAIARRPGWLRPLPVALGALALVALLFLVPRLFRGDGLAPATQAGVNSLAVMPLINMKDAQDPERLGQILQELIITDLSELASLKVYSSQRLFDIQKQLGRGEKSTIDRDIAGEVARTAGASTMLTGSLTQIGPQWTLLGQLVSVDDGSVIKSERVDGEDLFAMVDELTTLLRDDLGVDLSGHTAVGLAVTDKTTSSLEAYQHYLTGVDALNDRHFDDAAKSLQKAVNVDPAFGAAYYKLAIAGWWFNPDSGWWTEHAVLEPEEALDRMISRDTKLTSKDRLLAEAVRPLIVREYVDAIDPFGRLVEEYPDEKEAWYGLGEALFHGANGDDERALAAFEKTLELDPSFGLAYRHLSDIYRNQRKYEEGAERIRRLIDADPEGSTLWIDWVRLATLAGEPAVEPAIEEALAQLSRGDDRRELLHRVGHELGRLGRRDNEVRFIERALEIDSDKDTAALWRDLGFRARARQDDAEAERFFERALAIDAQDTSSLLGLSRVYERGLRRNDALERFHGLVQANPDFPDYFRFWGRAAIQSNREDETRLALQEELERATSPEERKDVYLHRSEDHAANGDVLAALEYARQALAAAPDDNNAILNLAGRLSAVRSWEEARDWYTRLIEENPENGRAREGAARTKAWLGVREPLFEEMRQLRQESANLVSWREPVVERSIVAGRPEVGESVLAESLELMESDAARQGLYLGAARGYQCVGDLDNARKKLEDAAQFEVENVLPLLEQQSELGVAQRRFGDAERVVRQRLARTPRDPGATLDLAEVHLAAGDAGAAEELVRELIDAGGHGGRSYRTMALALAALGRHEEADPFARRALEMDPRREIQALRAWVLIAGKLDLERGIELAREALEMRSAPCVSDFRNLYMPLTEHVLGVGYLEQEKNAEAVPLLERAAELRPGDAVIAGHLRLARGGR